MVRRCSSFNKCDVALDLDQQPIFFADHVSGPMKRPKLEVSDPASPPNAGDVLPRVSAAATAAGQHDDLSRSGGADSEPEYAAAEYGYGGGAAAAAAAAVANAVGGGSGDDGPPGAFGTPDAGAMAGALMGKFDIPFVKRGPLKNYSRFSSDFDHSLLLRGHLQIYNAYYFD